ncbi:spore germination protein YaaH [Paenibacillus cellulosilyticus]|uniref:Spore germination protein YaaH n=1 Tax=Paenibacillus cellulosilyticus TaxID=375489 RepID=A0A2V2YSK2_9BACL|nr:S-layer homology domain-containing protein [Paenibacillus cellulosilyticus]PWV99733.1 spore germination protein YaaH [Paenibacillus cellulosilyticus]QKS44838.1 S-layer homology domain-containing protein [Paenibacillus cellulosilyticus]
MKRVIGKIAAAFVGLCLIGQSVYGTSTQSTLPFTDISSSYAKEAIIDLYSKNIMNGTTISTFSPDKPITRAEFTKSLDTLLGLDSVASDVSPFTDVPKTAWYYGWIQAAVQLGIANGTSASTFSPTKSVTRQEAAQLLVRALQQTTSSSAGVNDFKDAGSIASWAQPAVATAKKLGLMNGDSDGKFRPTDSITREEAAAMLDRVLQNDEWSAQLKKETADSIRLGWQYGQTTAEFEQTVLQSNVNTLSPRWYFIESSGTITDNTDKSLVTWANKNNKKIWAMVGNHSDQQMTHEMLSDSTTRTKVVNSLASAVKSYGLAGLNIDFENVAPEDRSNFTTFITELKTKLSAIKAVLSVSVSPDLGTDWTDAFDYAALGKQADYIVMMGYDEYWSESTTAGPNASITFVSNAVEKLRKSVADNKIILAMPLYLMDWTLKSNGSVSSSSYMTIKEQNKKITSSSLRPVWNESLGLYTVQYTANGAKHRLWIEDGRSLTAKYRLIANANLAGWAVWYVGAESTDIWTSLRNAEKYYGYAFS